jgi:hypothetical protein
MQEFNQQYAQDKFPFQQQQFGGSYGTYRKLVRIRSTFVSHFAAKEGFGVEYALVADEGFETVQRKTLFITSQNSAIEKILQLRQ